MTGVSASKTSLVIRADASDAIGTGHVMRCLTLADEALRRGTRALFVCRHLPDHLAKLLADHGHELARIGGGKLGALDELPHSAWLGTAQAWDARETAVVLEAVAWDWLVVDHYALDARWEAELAAPGRHILVIDDLADRRHLCDVLLDQNFYRNARSRYEGKVPPYCRMLLGPAYAMLREEFRVARKAVVPRSGAIGRVLVFFGGVDLQETTLAAARAVVSAGIPRVDIVVGASYPGRAAVEAICASSPGCELHVQTPRIAELMLEADVCLGAVGSSTWERACLGLPVLAASLALNQQEIAQEAEVCGILSWLGNVGASGGLDWEIGFRRFRAAPQKLCAMSRTGLDVVDGAGVIRVVDSLGIGEA